MSKLAIFMSVSWTAPQLHGARNPAALFDCGEDVAHEVVHRALERAVSICEEKRMKKLAVRAFLRVACLSIPKLRAVLTK